MKNQSFMQATAYIVKYKPEQNHVMKTDAYLLRNLSSPHFEHEIPLVALGNYKPDSHGEDDFSRKQAWFYTYGDENIAEEFQEQFVELINKHFADDGIEWDLMTLYPTHNKNRVNANLRDLMKKVARKTGINLEQVLERTHTVTESHELDEEQAKMVNLKGSIDVNGDVDGKNVLLVDNIALSGISLLHGAKCLKQKGAENVLALCIGTKAQGTDSTSLNATNASQLL